MATVGALSRKASAADSAAAADVIRHDDPRVAPTDLLTSGESVIPRDAVTTATLAMTSSSMRLTYWTARRTETITQVKIISGTTAASTPTLIRVGIYSIATNGDATLVASTASDTALLAAASTAYTKALSSSWSKTAGQRYAFGILEVATTPATLTGQTINALANTDLALAPRLTGTLAAQSDLPSTYTDASLGTASGRAYAVVLP